MTTVLGLGERGAYLCGGAIMCLVAIFAAGFGAYLIKTAIRGVENL